MSIASLFIPNGYDLKCSTLDCSTLNAANVAYNDLRVNNNLKVDNDIRVDNDLSVGRNLDVGGDITGNITFTGDVNVNDNKTLTATGPVIANTLRLGGIDQTPLNMVFFHAGVLAASGAAVGDRNYTGCRINNFVMLSINGFDQNAAAGGDLVLQNVELLFRPEADKTTTVVGYTGADGDEKTKIFTATLTPAGVISIATFVNGVRFKLGAVDSPFQLVFFI